MSRSGARPVRDFGPGLGLRSVAIEGFRSIRWATVEFGPLTVLVGDDATARTDLLRFFRLFGRSPREDLNAFVADEGGLSAMLCAGSAEITFRVVVRHGHYRARYRSVDGQLVLVDATSGGRGCGDVLPWADVRALLRACPVVGVTESDSAQRFARLATLLQRPPALLLLDAPGPGLDPAAIPHLALLLRQAATHTQVVVATGCAALAEQVGPVAQVVALRAE